MSEAVTVTAYTTPIDIQRPGAAANISQAQKEALPTISRSMIDIVRINPYFNAITTNNTVTAVSVAGRNARYNNIQIDGAVNNDLFGLAETGTPGGHADTQPISLDAIQELQLVVSPYDIRQSGFSGGGINAVTKSGANKLSGIGVLLRPQPGLGRQGRHQHAGRRISPTSRAASASAAASCRTRRSSSATWTGAASRRRPASASQAARSRSVAPAADVDRIFSILENKYGYTIPDASDEFSRTTNSDKYLAKIRLQREAQSPDDGAAQLRERAQRHRGHGHDRAT